MGGIDKHCIIEAILVRHGRFVVEVSDKEILAAVSRASRRLARRLVDKFERSRDLQRRRYKPPAGSQIGEFVDEDSL